MIISSKTTRAALAAATTLAALAAPTAASAAETLYGVTQDQRLVQFNSDSPGSAISSVALKNFPVTGEKIVGIDIRPNTLGIYAESASSRLYLINPANGDVRQIGPGPFSPALTGASFGFDFNPTVDRIRAVSDADQNLRLNPDTGTVAATDAPLNYRAGDPGAGTNPNVTASAYTNSVPGATTTTLFGIDTARDTLVTQVPPNDGTLNTVGPLGVDVGDPTGFDIGTDGTAYLAAKPAGSDRSQLYRVDLNTGKATPVSANAAVKSSGSAPNDVLEAMAAAGTIADDKVAPEVSVAFSSTILEQNTDVLKPSIACDESCDITVSAKVSGKDAGTATESIVGGPGQEIVEVKTSEAARQAIANSGTELIELTITVKDAAGNTVTRKRNSRTQTLADRRG